MLLFTSRPLISRFLLSAALVCATFSPAHAAETITEDAVHAFYKQSAESFKLPYDQYLQTLTAMMTDTYTATSKVVIEMPGQPPAEQSDTMTKQQSITSAEQVYTAMKGASMSNEVVKITIAADGKSAQVTDSTEIRNMAMGPAKANGRGLCNDTVVLNAKGDIQIDGSNCLMKFSVTPPKQ